MKRSARKLFVTTCLGIAYGVIPCVGSPSHAVEILQASMLQPPEPTTGSTDIPGLGDTLSVDGDLIAQPQIPEQDRVPIPQHPGRRPPATESTRPVAAQPQRELQRTPRAAAPHRERQTLPMPGRPSRNLAPPGEAYTEPTTTSEEERLGLLNWLPHEFNGISVEYVYTGGLFTNAFGGLETGQATRFRGGFDLVVNFDTEGMGLWEGGRLFLFSQSLHGSTLSANEIGDFQLYDNLDSSPRPNDITQLAEFWYQQYFAEDVWGVKIGKQDANADFALTDLGGEFMHSSFGLIPTVPLPTFPQPTFGAALFLQPNSFVGLSAGIYDGGSAEHTSRIRTLGSQGALTLFQLQLTPQLGPNGEFAGAYRAGVFHHSGNWSRPDELPGEFDWNYGYWLTADQMLYLEDPSAEDQQGLGVFAQYGWSPSDRNTVSEYYGAGVVIRGGVPQRDEDVIGVGIAVARFSDLLRPDHVQETALEAFYRIRISPWVALQPELFYIASPNGELKDALSPGGRLEVVF